MQIDSSVPTKLPKYLSYYKSYTFLSYTEKNLGLCCLIWHHACYYWAAKI